MYLHLRTGKRGEVVIPAILRRKYGIKPGKDIKVMAGEGRMEFMFEEVDVVKWFKETAQKEKIKPSELIYGDKLYEEVFR